MATIQNAKNHAENAQETAWWRVLVYENGRSIGGLSTDGTAQRLVIHQAILTEEKAKEIAESINNDAEQPEISAKAAPFRK